MKPISWHLTFCFGQDAVEGEMLALLPKDLT